MPTLQLFDWPVTTPDAAHNVRSPGGYETWRFTAYDPSTQKWITIHFHQGFACREYLHRYMRYMARPTRYAPPLPFDYAAISISTDDRNRSVVSTTRIEPVLFNSNQHSFFRDNDGAAHLRIPSADLIFRPRFVQKPSELFLNVGSPTHRWRLTDGLCDVRGKIEVGGRETNFAGIGFHDQQYGDAPPLAHSCSGYFFIDGQFTAFKHQRLMHLATFASDSLKLRSEMSALSPRGYTRWGLSYPCVIRFNDGTVLNDPRVVLSTALAAKISYQADSFGEKGVGFCEVSAMRRLTWPVVGSWL